LKEFKLIERRFYKLDILDEDGFPYLMSRRPGSWYGFTDTKIFMGGRLLLICTFPSIIRSGFKLKFQDLPKPVSLVKYEGRRGLIVVDNFFSVHKPFGGKPAYQLYKNDQLCGEVIATWGAIGVYPFEYRVSFQEDSEDHLYSLVCLMTYFIS
jgi:hypothetical protein